MNEYDTQVFRMILIDQDTDITSFKIDEQTQDCTRLTYESTNWWWDGKWLVEGDGQPTIDMLNKIKTIYQNCKTYSELQEERRTIIELML